MAILEFRMAPRSAPGSASHRNWFRRHWLFSSFLGVALVLFLIAHFYLHAWLVRYVNQKLDNLEGYQGHLDDIGIHLWRGAYSIEGLNIEKDNGKSRVPFVKADDIDISVQWKELFNRHLVAEIEITNPVINLVTSEKHPEEKQTEIKGSWQDQVSALIPFRLNFIKIINGTIHFRDFTSDPPMDIYLHHLRVIASNLTNSKRISQSLAATITGDGMMMKDGHLTFEATADPYEKLPTFKSKLKLTDLSMPELNTFLKKYGEIEVKDGKFNLYSEVAGKDGEIKGYVKPIINDLDEVHLKPEKKSVGEVFKGLGVKAGLSFLTNDKKDRVGTRLEFSGRYDQPNVNPWVAISSALVNAIVHPIPAKLDQSIDMNDRSKTEIHKLNTKPLNH